MQTEGAAAAAMRWLQRKARAHGRTESKAHSGGYAVNADGGPCCSPAYQGCHGGRLGQAPASGEVEGCCRRRPAGLGEAPAGVRSGLCSPLPTCRGAVLGRRGSSEGCRAGLRLDPKLAAPVAPCDHLAAFVVRSRRSRSAITHHSMLAGAPASVAAAPPPHCQHAVAGPCM